MKTIYLSDPRYGPDPYREQFLQAQAGRPPESDWALWNLAMLFHVQSEHFDRTVPHFRNDRGVAIPTGQRRDCQRNAERLLNSLYQESIKDKYNLSYGQWVKLTRDVTHQFESMLQQGWMDKNAAIKKPDGEITFVPRDQLAATGYRLDIVVGNGAHRVTTYRPTGKFIVQHGACAEIFEPKLDT